MPRMAKRQTATKFRQMTTSDNIHSAVANLYNAYPFPPEPLHDEPPLGFNWRWNWIAAHSFCTGRKPASGKIRILDAGCGTGCGTEYLVYLNPEAEVTAIDISEGALAVARDRCSRSVGDVGGDRLSFQQMPLENAAELPGQFDFINCVGVLHHLPDPVKGLQALAAKLAPGGIFHIFVYGELGRWEIALMQKAIALLQEGDRGDYQQGVAIGRQLFATLPEANRLVKREKERWAHDNQRDATFADMYVHPQEFDYNIESLFAFIDASGLEFVGFSNPRFWQPERLLADAPELLARAQNLSDRERYRLLELLDPEGATHYEFFLAKPPLPRQDWSDDAAFLAAIPERHPCLEGWEGKSLFNCDFELVPLSDTEFEVMKACDGRRPLGELLAATGLELEAARSLFARRLLVLAPGH